MNKKDYSLVRFEKSKKPQKKYDAILKNKKTKKIVRVPFGGKHSNGVPYQQYKDSTGLGLYSHLNHNDRKRRDAYRSRHKHDNLNSYSPGYFAMRYLWT